MMAWLAWEAWAGASERETARGGAGTAWGSALRGGLVNLVNPKAMLFFVVVAPRFLGEGGLTFGSAVALGAVSVTIATLVHIAVVAAGASAHDWVADPARTRTVRRLLAVGLAAVALWFLIG